MASKMSFAAAAGISIGDHLWFAFDMLTLYGALFILCKEARHYTGIVGKTQAPGARARLQNLDLLPTGPVIWQSPLAASAASQMQ